MTSEIIKQHHAGWLEGQWLVEERARIQEALTESGILTCRESNPIITLLCTILSLYSSISIELGDDLQAYRKLSRYVSNLSSPNGFGLARHLEEYGVTTRPELVNSLKMTWPTATRVIKNFCDMGIIRSVGTVGSPYSKPSGPRVALWALKDATPEQATQAQIRYGSLVNLDEAMRHIDEGKKNIREYLGARRAIDLKDLPLSLAVDLPTLKAAAHGLNREGYKIWM